MPLSDSFLNTMRLEADPTADAVIARIVEDYGAQEARRIFDLLISNIELPEDHLPTEVMAFFESNSDLPEWADPDRIIKGQQLFVDQGPSIMVLLYYKALPTTYTLHRGANVLYQTGRLTRSEQDRRRYSRRIAETAQFVINCMAPGNLLPGGKGIRATQKIRLIHASIRKFIPDTSWNAQELGKPINQEDMAATLMSFSSLMLDGLELLGVKISEEDQANYFYAWRVVGHFMGLRPELNPEVLADGRAMMTQILKRQSGESEAGKALANALVDFAEELSPGKLFDQAPIVLIEFLAGPSVAKTLGLAYRSGCVAKALPAVLKQTFGIVEKLDSSSKSIDIIMDKVNMALLKGLIGYFNPDKKVNFNIPPALQKAWGLTS